MLAIVIDDSHLIAMAAVVPSMISAAVGWVAWRTNRHARTAANSVRPNGQGTVVEIVEEILTVQRTMQSQQLAGEARTAARLSELADRVARCEGRHDTA